MIDGLKVSLLVATDWLSSCLSPVTTIHSLMVTTNLYSVINMKYIHKYKCYWGADTFQIPFFELFVLSRSRFSSFSSALGPILRFYLFQVTTFPFVHSRTIKMGFCVRSGVAKIRSDVCSR